jgi:hypothetical protein
MCSEVVGIVMHTGGDGTGSGLGPVPYRPVEGWSRRDTGSPRSPGTVSDEM